MKLRTKWILTVMILLLMGVFYLMNLVKNKDLVYAKDGLPAEQYLLKYMTKWDGRIQTDLLNQKDVYLSETVGLWLDYLLLKDDEKQFAKQVGVLKKHFLTEDHLVTWEIQNKKKAPANASIDDLRIMNALFEASAKWNEPRYSELALKMARSLGDYQINDEFMVDYIDLVSKYQGTVITLSYIIPSAFNQLHEHNSISQQAYTNMQKLLVDMPHTSIGFYPKSYDIRTKNYLFDEEVNMIDQFYIGYHRAQWEGDVKPLITFTKQALANGSGKLYGRYDLKTGKAVVDYEGAAVYALAILMCLEVEEKELAKELIRQMQAMQQLDEQKAYYGGYIDIVSLDTHTFDNLLALIAERKMLDEEALY